MKLEFERGIDPGHPALPGHFPGNPIVPGVVILAQVENAISAAAGRELTVERMTVVKFHAVLRPGEPFRLELEELEEMKFRFGLERNGQRIVTGVAVCASGPGPA